MFVLLSVNHAGPRASIPVRNLPAHEIRANLADLDALGHGNRARARRETAFCAAKIVQQPTRPGPRSPALDPRVCQIGMQTPRFSISSPSSIPASAYELDRRPDFFALFCGFCQKSPKNRRTRWPNLERIFSKKSRIGGFPPVLSKKTWTGLRDPRPLLNEIRRTDRRIGQGPRPIGSDRWPSIIGSAPAIRRAHTRPAGCKGHVSDK